MGWECSDRALAWAVSGDNIDGAVCRRQGPHLLNRTRGKYTYLFVDGIGERRHLGQPREAVVAAWGSP